MLSAILAQRAAPVIYTDQNEFNNPSFEILARAASLAFQHSYRPYADIKTVGAAIETSAGTIYVGSLVQNAAMKPTTDPVLSAFLSASAAGERQIKQIVLYGEPEYRIPSAIAELITAISGDVPVVTINHKNHSAERSLISGIKSLPAEFKSSFFEHRYPDAIDTGLVSNPVAYKELTEAQLELRLKNLGVQFDPQAAYAFFKNHIESVEYKEFLATLVTSATVAVNSYCIKSNFPVAAALLGYNGTVVAGVNSEGIRETDGNCAEGQAIATYFGHGLATSAESGVAKLDPAKTPRLIAVFTPIDCEPWDIITPCGVCLQKANELGGTMSILGFNANGTMLLATQVNQTFDSVLADQVSTSAKLITVDRADFENPTIKVGSLTTGLFGPAQLGDWYAGSPTSSAAIALRNVDFPRGDSPTSPYHTQIEAASLQIAGGHLIVVGDDARVSSLWQTFGSANHIETYHRGLRSIMGILNSGEPLGLVSHGMGEGSSEITIEEIRRLSKLRSDGSSMLPESMSQRLTAIRLGTSGALRAKIGTLVISSGAISLGSLASFYNSAPVSKVQSEYIESLHQEINSLRQTNIEKRGFGISAHSSVTQQIPVQYFPAHPEVIDALIQAAEELQVDYVVGTTVTSPGFFAPQGRTTDGQGDLLDGLDTLLRDFAPLNGRYLENFEMEGAVVLQLLMQHRAGVAALAIADRTNGLFDTDSAAHMEQHAQVVLRAHQNLRAVDRVRGRLFF